MKNYYSIAILQSFHIQAFSDFAEIITAHNKERIMEYLRLKSINKCKIDNAYYETNSNDNISELDSDFFRTINSNSHHIFKLTHDFNYNYNNNLALTPNIERKTNKNYFNRGH